MKAKNLGKIKKFARRGIANKEPVLIMASVSQLQYIDTLLRNAILPQTQLERIEAESINYTEGEAQEKIEMLLDNQTCPISSGRNYGQKDILKKLKQIK